MDLPFQLETDLEKHIYAALAWQQDATWGKQRPGLTEGKVIYHIAEVLANIDRLASTNEERCVLRLIALIHDNFKLTIIQSIME